RLARGVHVHHGDDHGVDSVVFGALGSRLQLLQLALLPPGGDRLPGVRDLLALPVLEVGADLAQAFPLRLDALANLLATLAQLLLVLLVQDLEVLLQLVHLASRLVDVPLQLLLELAGAGRALGHHGGPPSPLVPPLTMAPAGPRSSWGDTGRDAVQPA